MKRKYHGFIVQSIPHYCVCTSWYESELYGAHWSVVVATTWPSTGKPTRLKSTYSKAIYINNVPGTSYALNVAAGHMHHCRRTLQSIVNTRFFVLGKPFALLPVFSGIHVHGTTRSRVG